MVVTHTYIHTHTHTHTHTQKSHPSHPITGLRRIFWQSASPNSWKTTFFLMQWLLKVQERLVWNITHTQIWPGFTGTSLSLTITSVSYGLSQSLNHYGYLCYRLCLLSCGFQTGFLFCNVERVHIAMSYMETCWRIYQAMRKDSHTMTYRQLLLMFKVYLRQFDCT